MKQEEPVFYYYYLRDPVFDDFKPPKDMKKEKALGFPRITVCLGVKGNTGEPIELARGMAICSFSECNNRISKMEGRRKAKGMVIKALAARKTSGDEEIVRPEAYDAIDYVLEGGSFPAMPSGFFSNRSVYQPELTDFEKKLIGLNKEE